MRHLPYALLVAVVIATSAGLAAAQAQDPQAAEVVPQAQSNDPEGLGHGGWEICQAELARAQVGFFWNDHWPTLSPGRTRNSEENQAFWLFFGPLSQVTEKTSLFSSAPLNRINTQPTAIQAKADDDKPMAAKGKEDDEKLRKLLEIQQKQIQTLEKMVKLLAEEVKKPPPVGPAVEKLQTQAAVLEARQQQAAQRDQDVANAIDDLRESADAGRRLWPDLPATLRELFNRERTNESPFCTWGTLTANFAKFGGSNSEFTFDFLPHFYLLLNEHFMMEINPDINSVNTFNLYSAQLDWCLTDNLCVEIGRFYAPLGFFNDRLHTAWVFKTPDRPLMFSQVLPEQLNVDGINLRGAMYPTSLPVKLEYATFVANGFSLPAANNTAKDFADLFSMKDASTRVNNQKAFGGRVGLNFPEHGVTIGGSGLCNGAYDVADKFDLNIWDIDAGYHQGNWDFRFEYANTTQQAPVMPIHRRGFYTQVAYRPYHLPNGFLQKMEAVFRFDQVRFTGIDLAKTGLVFSSRETIPVDRNRYTFSLNHYLYESLILKFAFEINQEVNFRSLKDSGFIFQMAWGY
jgi:hypothetical protein